MPSKTWGTPQTITQYEVVTDTTEIPAGSTCRVFSQSTNAYDTLFTASWAIFKAGNMDELRSQIESQIPNSQVTYLCASWNMESTYFDPITGMSFTAVYGFKVEAIVKNIGGAAMTGLEIVALIMAVAFLATVLAAIALSSWIVWKIIESTPTVLIPIVGIVLLILIGVFLLILFGSKLGISKKGVTLGK